MVGTFSLGSFVLLVEYSGRLFRNGEAGISSGVRDVLERLGRNPEFWYEMMKTNQLRGCIFAAKAELVKNVVKKRGVRTAGLCPQ